MSKAQRIKTAGLTVNCRIEGSGPPLLFLGGSNFDQAIKAPVFDSELPKYFTVAACDPRGLGGTDAPPGDWTMRDYANDAVLVLDALGWGKADILGESFGAMVALHLAANSPDRINRLALAAGSPGGAGGSSYAVECFLDIVDPLERARTALGIIDSRFATIARNDPAEASRRVAIRAAGDAVFISSHNNRTGYPRLLQARAGHDCWNQLPEIDISTTIFAGRYDQQAPLERSENMQRVMPQASLHIIDGCHGHCFATSEPVEILIQRWVV